MFPPIIIKTEQFMFKLWLKILANMIQPLSALGKKGSPNFQDKP